MKGKVVPLKDLFQIGSSKRVLKSQWKAEGVPFYRGREVTRLAMDGFVDNELFISEAHYAELANQYGAPRTDDIVITAIGTIGNSYIVQDGDRFYFKDASILWMKRISDVSSKFVNFWLKSTMFLDQLDHGNGATVDTLTIQKLQSVQIWVPPIAEQHRIVSILDEAFEGIAKARAHAEQNRQNARALFESHLQSVFTQRGEGWVEASIGDICTLRSGTSLCVSLEKSEGEIPYVKVSDMTYTGNDTEIVASSRYLNMADIGKNAVFPTGTTIFPKRGGAILTNKKRLTALPICADLNIMGVIPPSNMHPGLLYFYFLNIDMRLIGSGSSIPQINNYDIAPLKISFPESQENQKKIVRQLEGLAGKTQRLESLYQQKLAALDELKKSLLHQAFSGSL